MAAAGKQANDTLQDNIDKLPEQIDAISKEIREWGVFDLFTDSIARREWTSHLIERSLNSTAGWVEFLFALALMVGGYFLLDNARKYGAEPIAIATRSQGNEVVIDVIDSGPGVPESEVERLKRPFTRLQDARTDASGTGLGLAIVERVARLHGGKFELLNRNEGGLIARLRLPLQ